MTLTDTIKALQQEVSMDGPSSSSLLAGVLWPSNGMRRQIVPVFDELCDDHTKLLQSQSTLLQVIHDLVGALEEMLNIPLLKDAHTAITGATSAMDHARSALSSATERLKGIK